MKILSSQQIKEADAFTIQNEPIDSINLMERASRAFVNQFLSIYYQLLENRTIKILCGLGNNGGDGLAIARMLHQQGLDIEVFIIQYSEKSSPDFQKNLLRLQKQLAVNFINNTSEIPSFKQNEIIIDAIFGSGLSRNLEGIVSEIVEKINDSHIEVVAVDIPTGLFSDQPNDENAIILKASQTISFQLAKLAFMFPQNAEFVGNWQITDIGLSENFINNSPTNYYFTTSKIEKLIQKRPKFSHKGNFGNALLIAGSRGMMGAAVLSARACMRAGVGKLTVHVPSCGYEIMQISVPEAMISQDENPDFVHSKWSDKFFEKYNAIGIGCGLSTSEKITDSITKLIENSTSIPLVIDADAINAISTEEGRKIIKKLPKNTILTPHPKEFQKLVNKKWKNDYEKLEILKAFAIENQVIICLKGSHTAIALPDGTIHFNSTGNPYMATAGSGDVLTGIILSLLAQGFEPKISTILGVYLHGKAGDLATQQRNYSTIIASDIIEKILL